MLGLPSLLKSDGGQWFRSAPLNKFCDKYNIQHVLTSAYHAPSNGQVELGIQEVKRLLDKNHQFSPYHVCFTLNQMERAGGLSTPLNWFLGRPTRALEPNPQNKILDIVENIALRRKKAL